MDPIKTGDKILVYVKGEWLSARVEQVFYPVAFIAYITELPSEENGGDQKPWAVLDFKHVNETWKRGN